MDMSLTATDRGTVAGLPLLAVLDAESLARLVQFASIQRHPAGTLLFNEGDDPQVLHVLISGTVEIFSNARGVGPERGVMLMNSGDILMPGAVLYSEPYVAAARTLVPSRLLALDGAAVRAEAAASADFAMQLGRAMTGQFRVAVRQVVDLKSRNAAQRLGSFLLKLADNSGASHPELPMRKRNLAARIGMTPETLSRTLQILANNGLLLRGREIIVRDRDRIESFCGPEPYRPPTEDSLQVHAL